ncbi:MAG: hypothetical protein R3F31_08175 [Verrucomicrobiales bacterium]
MIPERFAPLVTHAATPPITTEGTVLEVRKPDQLYLVALANGHRAMGVREKHLPRAPEGSILSA